MSSSVLGCIRTSQPRRFLFFSGKKSQGVDERHVVLVGQHLTFIRYFFHSKLARYS
jgi:hypothetical protein